MPYPDLTGWRDKLIALRAELRSVAETGDDAASTVELDQTRVGRLSRMDALRAQEMSVEVRRRRELQLTRISAALRRVEDGTFGYCLDCEDEIDARRLAFDPTVTRCVACASRAE